MKISIVKIQLLSLFLLTTNTERILYPPYCYDHTSTILVSFSTNVTYDDFAKYLTDFARVSDCSGSNELRYVFGNNTILFDCLWYESNPACIQRLFYNESNAHTYYTAAKDTNGDILQVDDERNRTDLMRGNACNLVSTHWCRRNDLQMGQNKILLILNRPFD